MKSKIINITLLLAAQFVMFIGAQQTAECYCGYGGLCLKDLFGNFVEFECSEVCPIISGRFYNEDCHTIRNHCDPSPCILGKCVSTFGSFYCECPHDYFGKTCNYHNPSLTKLGLNNRVYVYHQVQPDEDGTCLLYVVYDSLDPKVLAESGFEISVALEFIGRIEYPERGEHFVLYNVKEKCLADVKLNPDLYDSDVCNYLPAGEVWTYAFGCTVYIPSYQDLDETLFLHGKGKIGRYQPVRLQIDILNGPAESHVLFEETYTVFTYNFQGRIPHNCQTDIVFQGCSTDKNHPSLYSTGDLIRIAEIVDMINCKGILILGRQWFLQRNVNRIQRYPFDRVKKMIDDDGDRHFLSFRPRYFQPGLHALVYVLNLRGRPPFVGDTQQFSTLSRCWINVTPGTPSFGIEGGPERTVNCYQNLRVEVVLQNGNFKLSEFTFVSSCSVTEDAECNRRDMEGPYLNKVFTPCNKVYDYTITATHRLNITPPVEFPVKVIFVESDTELLVKCIYNCFPIDPELIVLVGVWTNPYAPGRVQWDVTVKGSPLDPKHILTTGFHHSSRILHINSAVFLEGLNGTEQSVDVVFRPSKDNKLLNASLSCKVNILKSDLSQFELRSTGYDYYFVNTTKVHFLINNPMTYTIYSVHEEMRELILETRTNYIGRVGIRPQLNKVILCLKDSLKSSYTQKCTDSFNLKDWKPPPSSLAQLERDSRMRDTGAFLTHTQGYLIQNLGGTITPTPWITWYISQDERNQVRLLMSKVELLGQFEMMSALSIVSMLFYSEQGCKDQGLPVFKEDLEAVSLHTVSTWLKADYVTILVLKLILHFFNQLSSISVEKLRDFGYGDVLDKILSTWTLAYLRDTFIADLADERKPVTVRDHIMSAEIDFWHAKNYDEMSGVGLVFIRLLLKVQKPFYGLRYLGRGAVRAWATQCPYSCILAYLNKSNPAKDTFHKHVNYIFETPTHEENWISIFNLTLPDSIPGWEYEKLYFVTTVIRNRKTDVEVAPLVIVDIRTETGSTKRELARDNGYRIILPAMQNGELSDSRHQLVNHKYMMVNQGLLSRQSVKRSMSVYRITLPLNMTRFAFFVYSEKPVAFKVLVTYENTPSYDDLENTADKVGKFDEGTKLYLVTVPLKLCPGEMWIRRTIYLSFLPSNTTPVGVHYFWGQNAVPSCEVSQLVGSLRMRHSCINELSVDATRRIVVWNQIKCHCFNFGSLMVKELPLHSAKALVGDIYFVTVEPSKVPGAIVWSLLLLAIGIVLLIAILLDRKRAMEHMMIYVEDAYPVQTPYALIVGVFTGMNPLAGTSSSVAIKITGAAASSRVHILNCQSRRTFVSGNDDWFVIPVSQQLGKVTSVSLWLDFKRLSDWYCSQIMIYDVTASRWYFVKVQRWLKIYPSDEETKILTLFVPEIDRFDVDFDTYDHTFSTYYFKELRSTHLPFSLFHLHGRSIANYEEKYLLYIVKIFGVVFWVWAFLKFGLHYIFHESYEDESVLIRITTETTTMILLIALFSRIFTVPLQMLNKFKLVSRLLQKRTTQPWFAKPDYMRYNRSESHTSTRMSLSKTASEQRVNRPSRHDSRYFKPERKRSAQKYSVDLQRKSSRGPSLHELNWRKIAKRNRLVSLTLAPHQFRSVNVSHAVFKQKARRNHLTIRVVFGLLVLCFMAFFIYSVYSTDYLRRMKIACVLISLTLFCDAVLLDPILTFVKSFISFVFLNMTYKEVNMWNDDVKPVINPPPPLGFAEYAKKATGREYKPLLSSELDKKRKKHGYYKGFLLSLYYAAMLIAFISCYTTIQLYDIKSKWSGIRATDLTLSHSLEEEAVEITDIVIPKQVDEFVSSIVAAPDTMWGNGKYISPDSRRWGPDRTSTPLEATNLIALVLSKEKSYQAVPLELDEYLSNAYSVYSEEHQLSEPVMIGFLIVKYNETYSGSVLGKSRINYPFAGNTLQISNHPWKLYHVNLRYAVDNILRHPTLITRAVIFTTNYFNPNRQSFTTIDVVIEFLPSGLSSAVSHISSSIAFSSNFIRAQIIWTTMTFISILMSIFSFYLVCKPSDYFGKWQTFRMYVFFILCFSNAVFSAFVRYKKYLLLQTITVEYGDKFTDIHSIYDIDLWDQLLMAAVIFVVTLEVVAVIYRLMGSGRLIIIVTRSLRVVLVVYILTLYGLSLYQLCHYYAESRGQPFTLYVLLRQLVPLSVENSIYSLSRPVLTFFIIVAQVFIQFCTACAVFCSYQLNVDRPSVVKRFFLGVMKSRSGRAFAARFGNNFLQKSKSHQPTHKSLLSQADTERKPLRALSSQVDRKLSWLVIK